MMLIMATVTLIMATVTPESPQSLFLFFIAYSAVTIMYTPTYLYRYSTLSQVGGPDECPRARSVAQRPADVLSAPARPFSVYVEAYDRRIGPEPGY